MENDVTTLDNLDFDTLDNEQTNQENQVEPNSDGNLNNDQPLHDQENESTDAISDYLKTIGIKDSNKIKFEDEQGNIQEKSWNNLSEEEKLNILKTPNVRQIDPSEASTYGLDDSETNFINYLRQNNLSPDEYTEMLKQQIQNSITPEKVYQVDNYSDDELYLADMQLRAKDMSDEELQQSLENAKANPDSYAKYIQGLRNEYKALENQQEQQQEAELQAQQQEQYNQFSNSVINAIDNFSSIGDLDIDMSDDDKSELAQFILGQDGAGVNYITKALNDPSSLVAASWYLLHGQDAFNELQDYVANQVKAAHKAGYKEAVNKSKPQVIVNQNHKNQQVYNPISSIDDINFE